MKSFLFLCSLALAAAAADLPELVLPQGVGVNIHFTRGHERDLDLIAQAGFKFIRMDFGWAGIERKKGEYDWSAYDELTTNLDQRGLRAIYILDYSNPLYEETVTSKNPITGREHKDVASPQHPESVAAFAAWAGAAAKHFAGRRVIWEIWNEPNISFWKPKPDAAQYATLALATARAVREADPGATLIAPATSEVPAKFLEEVFAAGLLAHVDAVSVHPYRSYKKGPETAAEDYAKLRGLIEKHAPTPEKKRLPIISGEWGYSTFTEKGVSPETQAAFLARQQLANLYAAVPISIWYDWKNDGPDASEREHNFGTVTQDLQPKPAYVAVQTLTRQLSGYRIEKRLATAREEDWVLLLSKGTERKLAAWTTGEAHAATVAGVECKAASAVSGLGEPAAATLASGSLSLNLAALPQYVSLQGGGSTAAAAAPAAAESPAERDARLAWFAEARFGMFIHWGVYSGAGGVWKGKEVKGAGEWIQSSGKIPAAEYRAELLGRFNPVKYDPEAWVLAAKAAGMKYIVITSKHHDGFCLWDSKLTDWDVGSTPYGKDLLAPLAAACAKHGLRFCLYHSIMDWSHPDWGTKAAWRGNAVNPKPDMDRFTAYLKGQLEELVAGYHPAVLWFDGEWEDAWTHERGADLYDWLRRRDPAIIINNRVDKGRAGMHGHTTDPKFKGDFGTPEQEIPATGFGKGEAWESCMTMNDTWGFKTSDTHWKSATTLIRNLIDIASKGGNYLLNVGPTGEGEIPAASLDRLAAIGRWMNVNGESIHGTSASLFAKVSWDGRSTTRQGPDGTTLYLHLFNRPQGGKLLVRGLVDRPDTVTILGQPGAVTISGSAGAWSFQLPEGAWDSAATVLALRFRSSPKVQ